MNLQDFRILQLLEVIDGATVPPSQRDMARSLNISLGLVNAFLKRLVKKGFFKITHLPKNRVGYILTPQGAAEKSRLTYAYIQHSYRFYRDARKRFRKVFQKMGEEGCQRVAFFGAGELAEIGYISIQETDLEFCGVADIGAELKTMMGKAVFSLEELARLDVDKIVVTVQDGPVSAAKDLASQGIDPEKIQFL